MHQKVTIIEPGLHTPSKLLKLLVQLQKLSIITKDLTEAIALGHDLGHTPFGHNGEDVLNRIHPGGFKHNEQSLRIVERLECTSKRVGLNLTRK